MVGPEAYRGVFRGGAEPVDIAPFFPAPSHIACTTLFLAILFFLFEKMQSGVSGVRALFKRCNGGASIFKGVQKKKRNKPPFLNTPLGRKKINIYSISLKKTESL